MILEERAKRKQAIAYKPDERHEDLLKLRDTDPAASAKLQAIKRIALGHYLNEKQAWLELRGKL